MNTEFIAHRINTLEDLAQVPEGLGVELDLRDRGERLILQHDPFVDGIDFEDFLKYYQNRKTLILNIKSERIEFKVLEFLKLYSISDYFFLDSSFPMINTLQKMGEQNIAIRYSEFEGKETIYNMAGKIKWIWVDCFTRLPLTKNEEVEFHKLGFKLCLVSPELQGRKEDIISFKKYITDERIHFDSICTKWSNIDLWN